MRILRYRPNPATAIALTALVVALGGVAYATIPDSNGTIHSCYQKHRGNLRVVESSDECRSGEKALDWNQRGLQGPPGPAGNANVLTEGGTVAPGETITFLDAPGLVRMTLRCPGPDDFAGGISHYNYTTENLSDEPLFFEIFNGVRLEPGASITQVTTITQTGNEFGTFGGGKVIEGDMRLYRQPLQADRDQACVFTSQAMLSLVD